MASPSNVSVFSHSVGRNPSPWPDLVERIQAGKLGAKEELYKAVSEGIRFLLCRQLGPQDLGGKVHGVFLIVTEAICNGELCHPERLMEYVHTVVKREVASHSSKAIAGRCNRVPGDFQEILPYKSRDPEQEAFEQENLGFALSVLESIPRRDRDVLIRFYLNEESAEEIRNAMGLSETQFRSIKSRAKARFVELGKQRLASRPGSHV